MLRYETLLKELATADFPTVGKSSLGSSIREEPASTAGGRKIDEARRSPAAFQSPTAKTKEIGKHSYLDSPQMGAIFFLTNFFACYAFICMGPFKCFVTLFFGKIDTHPSSS